MNILFVTPFGTDAALLQNRILPLVSGLKRLSHFASLLSPPSNSQEGQAISLHIETLVRLLRRINSSALGLLTFPLAGFNEFQVVRHMSALAGCRLDYDVIYVSKPWMRTAGLALRLARRMRVPVVLDMDDYDIHHGTRLLKRFDGLVVASQELKRLFARFNPLYIPNTADLALFDPDKFSPNRGSTCTLVWSGIMYDYLKLDIILDAIANIRDANLLFMGKGPLRNKLMNLCGKPGLQSKVTFERWLDRWQVPERLSRTDIGLVHTANTRFERCKCPGKLFEYMAMRIPVVASDVGEAAHTIRTANCGLTYQHNNPRMLQQNLKTLMDNRDLRLSMGRNAREFLERKQNFTLHSAKLSAYLADIKGRHLRR